jgi:hypothetical protein
MWHRSARGLPIRTAIALLALCAAACAKRDSAMDHGSAEDAGGAKHTGGSDAALDTGGSVGSDAGVEPGSSLGSDGGGLGPWTSTADYPLATNNCDGTSPNLYCALQTCVASAGYAYCIGGASTSTYHSQLSSTGMGPWVPGANYPVPIQDASCVVSSSHIYCVGGRIGEAQASATRTADVYYAPLSASGIGSWAASTPFPYAGNPECMTDSGYIYCTSRKPDPPYEHEAYYAAISSSGVGAWATTAPPPTATAGCASTGGYAYCFGGGGCAPQGPGNDCYSPSYYAPLTASGIGTWKTTTELPTAVFSNYAITDSYMFSLSSPVFFASVSADGIGPWQMTTSYPKSLGPSNCFSSGTNLYCAHATTTGSYFAQIGAPNPKAFQLEDPPPFPRSEYLGAAWSNGGGGSVSGPGFFAGAPIYHKNIDEAAVFNCASQAATPAGCKTTVVSPTNTAYNYDLTVWYPCTSQTPENTNCCFRPALGYPDPFFAWCSSIGSNSFIVAKQIKLRQSQ